MNNHCRWLIVAVLMLTACVLMLPVQQAAFASRSESADQRQRVNADYPEDEAAAKEVFSPLDLELLSMINDARQEEDLPLLQPSPELAEVARSHAEEMIELEYFSHRSPHQGSPAARVRDAGLKAQRVGENLAGNSCISHAHEMLLASRAHRANLMSSSYDVVGVAVVSGSRYGSIIVQLFAGGFGEGE